MSKSSWMAKDSNKLADSIWCGELLDLADGSVVSGVCRIPSPTSSRGPPRGDEGATTARGVNGYGDEVDWAAGNVVFLVARAEWVSPSVGDAGMRNQAALMLPEVLVSDVGWVLAASDRERLL